jgi:hypothetical protein
MTLFEPVASRKSILWQPAWFSLWVAISLIGACLHPDPSGHGTHQELGLPPCPMALIFDRPCPGCGLTTSWTALLHGEWGVSFAAHPLGPALYIGFTVSALLALAGFLRGKSFVVNSVGISRFITACSVGFVVFGVYRMAVTPHYRTARETQILENHLP